MMLNAMRCHFDARTELPGDTTEPNGVTKPKGESASPNGQHNFSFNAVILAIRKDIKVAFFSTAFSFITLKN